MDNQKEMMSVYNNGVVKGHLDLGNNLYMPPMDNSNGITFDRIKPALPPTATRNIVKIFEHKASIAYSIKCTLKLIRY